MGRLCSGDTNEEHREYGQRLLDAVAVEAERSNKILDRGKAYGGADGGSRCDAELAAHLKHDAHQQDRRNHHYCRKHTETSAKQQVRASDVRAQLGLERLPLCAGESLRLRPRSYLGLRAQSAPRPRAVHADLPVPNWRDTATSEPTTTAADATNRWAEDSLSPESRWNTSVVRPTYR